MTIVPDGIDPVVGYRSWGFDGELLMSAHDSLRWPHGEPAEGECPYAFWEWVAVQNGGQTLADILKASKSSGVTVQYTATSATYAIPYDHATHSSYGPSMAPNVVLPEGWGYESQVRSHDVPFESCSCGLYASAADQNYPSNTVWGEVYLWGKVIKGAHAHRAQFAYPKKLHTVDEDIATELEAYGAEIVLHDRLMLERKEQAERASLWTPMLQQQYLQQVKVNWLDDFSMPNFTSGSSSSNSTISLSPLQTWWGNIKP